jgi:hypothetical protein
MDKSIPPLESVVPENQLAVVDNHLIDVSGTRVFLLWSLSFQRTNLLIMRS